MVLETKDVIYLIVYIVSGISLFLSMKNRQANFENELGQVRKILYGERGSLNLIDCKTCEKYRDEIFTAMRRNEKSFEMFFLEIREIKEALIELKIEIKVKKELVDGIKQNN